MKYYINNIATDLTLSREIKQAIPDMTMRRRMSRVVKMGVATAMETLLDFGEPVDAIITATGLGCIADSEKFLDSIIRGDEQMPSPTPFIQSTFNTVGAQVALLTGNHGYNMTYTHGGLSFESALLDAMMRLDLGESDSVLVGAVDESTSTQRTIMERMGLYRGRMAGGEGAVFFVLTAEPRAQSVGVVESLEFLERGVNLVQIKALYGSELSIVEESFHTASAGALALIVKGGSRVVSINNYGGVYRSAMVIEPCI